MASLAHRLEVARTANNSQLVALLEQEQRQLTSNTVRNNIAPFRKTAPLPTSLLSWLQTASQRLAKAFSRRSELNVCEFVNGSDRWWYAVDPQTGRYVYADSEAELRLWIKENYPGK